MSYRDWWNQCYLGTSERMAEIPDESVQCIVTSPPYLGLRDYHVAGQIGLEAHLPEYMARLALVFEECRRVLREDGVMFVNMGDAYAGSWGAQGRTNDKGPHVGAPYNASISGTSIAAHPRKTTNTGAIRAVGLKPKDLMMLPARLAIALQEAGWWIRDDIIWHKPNPMPSSVEDRCSPAHEHIFMLTKSAHYFSDMDAVRRPLTESSLQRLEQPGLELQRGSTRANGGAKTNGNMKAVSRANLHNARYGVYESPSGNPDRNDHGRGRFEHDPAGANLKNVWSIETTGFPLVLYICENGHDFIERRPMSDEALERYRCGSCGTRVTRESHFATFPIELPSRCIRMGSRIGDVVLDPFAGSGTTFEVAESLGRRWAGYELNPTFHRFIEERTKQIGLFSA